jgi:hypothetical protein
MTIERTAAAWGEPQIAEPHVLHHRHSASSGIELMGGS